MLRKSTFAIVLASLSLAPLAAAPASAHGMGGFHAHHFVHAGHGGGIAAGTVAGIWAGVSVVSLIGYGAYVNNTQCRDLTTGEVLSWVILPFVSAAWAPVDNRCIPPQAVSPAAYVRARY